MNEHKKGGRQDMGVNKRATTHIDIQDLKARLGEARKKIDMLRGYL